MQIPARIAVDWTVNDVLRHFPDAAAVLNRFGIDTCCGGTLPLDEAAREAGVPVAELLGALDFPVGAA